MGIKGWNFFYAVPPFIPFSSDQFDQTVIDSSVVKDLKSLQPVESLKLVRQAAGKPLFL